jgi:valyl-tRNA synthetase
LEQQIAQARVQLSNQEFVARAPQAVVRGVERRLKELNEHYQKVVESLERVG